MKENLKTTRYNDGTSIPNVTNSADWSSMTTPTFCWYKDDLFAYKNTYGALYNWYAVNTGKLCPDGWHVPTYKEWSGMVTNIAGGSTIAGGKLKEIGMEHWLYSININNTDEFGFTALPGGQCDETRSFNGLTILGAWWSSTEYPDDTSRACEFNIYASMSQMSIFFALKQNAYSIRCIRD